MRGNLLGGRRGVHSYHPLTTDWRLLCWCPQVRGARLPIEVALVTVEAEEEETSAPTGLAAASDQGDTLPRNGGPQQAGAETEWAATRIATVVTSCLDRQGVGEIRLFPPAPLQA